MIPDEENTFLQSLPNFPMAELPLPRCHRILLTAL